MSQPHKHLKIELAIWILRGATNQLLPIAITLALFYLGKTSDIGNLAPVFVASGIANLLRSGAITATANEKCITSTLWIEIIYTMLSTIPFLLITTNLSQVTLLHNFIIIITSGLSGAFSARVEKTKGLSQIGLSDIASTMIAMLTVHFFMEPSVSSLSASLAAREGIYFLLIITRDITPPQCNPIRLSLSSYAKETLGQTVFWISGPWKDYLVTNTALAFYTSTTYGTYYATQLYWSLPSLFLGLILRPTLKSFQSGLLTLHNLKLHIARLMIVSMTVLALLQWLTRVIPPTSIFLTSASMLPAITSPFVVPAMLKAVKDNRTLDIALQNILWATIGCATLYFMRNEGLTGLGMSIITTNIASIYIVRKHSCSTSYT